MEEKRYQSWDDVKKVMYYHDNPNYIMVGDSPELVPAHCGDNEILVRNKLRLRELPSEKNPNYKGDYNG